MYLAYRVVTPPIHNQLTMLSVNSSVQVSIHVSIPSALVCEYPGKVFEKVYTLIYVEIDLDLVFLNNCGYELG